MTGERKVYLDTSALIALADKKDKNHKKAVEFFNNVIKKDTPFILGKHVLIEFIDGLTKRVGKKEGIFALESILKSFFIKIVWDTQEEWNTAIKYFNKYRDKEIDLTDCLSFAIMEKLSITHVFTFDSDFRIHGFIMVPL